MGPSTGHIHVRRHQRPSECDPGKRVRSEPARPKGPTVNNARMLFFVVIGAVVVGCSIMLVIYITQGGEGESTNIPTNPDAAARASADPRGPMGHVSELEPQSR